MVYPKHMSKFVISLREDMNPDNILEGITLLDAEMQRLETKYPDDCEYDDQQEIDEIIEGNRILREKVNEISNIVKTALTKINVIKHINIFRIQS
jgi:hypothetical protein